MRTSDRTRSEPSGVRHALRAGVLLVLCCAGPALVAAGALGVLGGVSRNTWLFVTAVTLFAGAVAWTAWRRRRFGHRTSRSAWRGGSCCE